MGRKLKTRDFFRKEIVLPSPQGKGCRKTPFRSKLGSPINALATLGQRQENSQDDEIIIRVAKVLGPRFQFKIAAGDMQKK